MAAGRKSPENLPDRPEEVCSRHNLLPAIARRAGENYIGRAMQAAFRESSAVLQVVGRAIEEIYYSPAVEATAVLVEKELALYEPVSIPQPNGRLLECFSSAVGGIFQGPPSLWVSPRPSFLKLPISFFLGGRKRTSPGPSSLQVCLTVPGILGFIPGSLSFRIPGPSADRLTGPAIPPAIRSEGQIIPAHGVSTFTKIGFRSGHRSSHNRSERGGSSSLRNNKPDWRGGTNYARIG